MGRIKRHQQDIFRAVIADQSEGRSKNHVTVVTRHEPTTSQTKKTLTFLHSRT
jgi:hypothetical protein